MNDEIIKAFDDELQKIAGFSSRKNSIEAILASKLKKPVKIAIKQGKQEYSRRNQKKKYASADLRKLASMFKRIVNARSKVRGIGPRSPMIRLGDVVEEGTKKFSLKGKTGLPEHNIKPSTGQKGTGRSEVDATPTGTTIRESRTPTFAPRT